MKEFRVDYGDSSFGMYHRINEFGLLVTGYHGYFRMFYNNMVGFYKHDIAVGLWKE